MTRLIEILISLAIVTALFLVVGLVLPSSRHIDEKVETNRKMTIVYDTLNSLRRFEDWNPLVLRDPRMQLQLSGPASGVGARLDYDSSNPQLGQGSWEIVATEPNASVTYAIVNPQRGHNKRSTFSLKPTGRSGRNVEITQSYDVDYGWDLLGRYAGLYVSRHVGDDMEMGLQRLTNMLAQVPNTDYRVQGSKLADLKVVEVPAEDLLVVSAGSIERNNQKIKDAMKADMEWIRRTMDASGLVAAGPMRIISTELGRENYTFDVAQPVRRAGAAAAGEESGTAAAPAPAAGAPLTGLKLQGPVKYVRTEAGRAATASYTGYMAELETVRNALRAWALTQGEESVGLPHEVYKNGIDQAFTADGQYQVYWMLK
ncbi:SRPBCC family protein [Cognatiluteimonas weifangensis]|uniref:Polyketide cyclase n=1 Tax=Cognatiluteimonas weifangensis TaxID=2303539 RepID=A0A372DLF4_9GAMM|nr:SRPBCC family protein [Luteimonas weifangensis]RFP60356.1 polyketide cyclase [Luteimonas weifangensis]